MADTNHDLSRFTRPNVQNADVVLAAAGGATAILEILPDDLRLDGVRRWVKRIIFAEHTIADPAAAPANTINTNFLGNLLARWYVRGRYEKSGTRRPVQIFDSQAWERNNPIVSGVTGLTAYPQVAWRLDHPVIVKRNQGVFVDWNNPLKVSVGAFPPAPAAVANYFVALHGKGIKTGWNRTLHLLVAVLPTPGANGAGVTGTSGPGPDGMNNFGEDLLIDRIVIHTDDVNQGVADYRGFNHIRFRVYTENGGISFTGCDTADYVPICMYGSHRNTCGRVSIHEIQGEPLILDGNEGESIGVELENTSASIIRAQVAVVSLVDDSRYI